MTEAIDIKIQEQATAIRKIVVGAIISEYGGLELLDHTKHELKQKVRRLLKSVDDLERYFIAHPLSAGKQQVFRNEFHKDEIFALSELVETCWGLSADTILEINEQIKKNIEDDKQ